MKTINFYDTCSLLLAGEKIFSDNDKFVISSITLKELERIKTAVNKDAEVKYSARLLLRLFDENLDKYEVVIHREKYEDEIKQKNLEINDDTRILSDAIYYDKHVRPDETIFITNDLCLKHIANLFFGRDSISSIPEIVDNYKGYQEVLLTEQEMAEFYTSQHINIFNLKIGEYLIIKNKAGEIVDFRVWTGEIYRIINLENFNSSWFGKVKPYEKDPYQKLLFDSLINNKITMVRGPAGSGKTFVSLAYLLHKLESNELDKIIVFCNTVATANSAKLGYYPGTRDEKLLDSQIGNLLSSKLGSKIAVE